MSRISISNAIKLISLAALFSLGAGAYAGTDDGNVSGNNSSQQGSSSSYQQGK